MEHYYKKPNTVTLWASRDLSQDTALNPTIILQGDDVLHDREYPINNQELPVDAACTSYGVGSAGFVPGATIDTVFSANGNFANKTDRTYFYYNGRPCLKQQILSINNGSTKYTTYKYAFTPVNEFTMGLNAAEQTMKTTLLNNNFMQPLEIVDSIKTSAGVGSFLSAQKFIFGNFNGSEIHLSKVRSYTSLQDSVEMNFTQYDANGNLQEQYKTNDVKEMYLWGYKNAYPVAKITGASSYATILSQVNTTVSIIRPAMRPYKQNWMISARIWATARHRLLHFLISPASAYRL